MGSEEDASHAADLNTVKKDSTCARKRELAGVKESKATKSSLEAEIVALKQTVKLLVQLQLSFDLTVVAGATGNNACDHFNGTYTKTDEMQNDMPVYSKDDDADTWCYCCTDGCWIVTDNDSSGFACSVEVGLAAPQLATAWELALNCVGPDLILLVNGAPI